MRTAVVFDIDGTLTDTTYLHTLAWYRALLECGEHVPAAVVHRRVGMGSETLLADLLGEVRSDVKRSWRRHFEAMKPDVRAFPRAADLLREVAARGALVVLASSSEEEDLAVLLQAIDAEEVIECVTSAGDVEEAKPSPEVFTAALAKAGVDACDAVAVGDTVWDVEAAARCGLGCVGVLTGGIAAAELEGAGAIAVYRDPAHLLAELDASPLGRLLG